MVLYAAADLIWATKIKGMADALGIAARPVRSMEMLEARLADCEVAALLVDLDKGEDGLALIARVRDQRASEKEKQICVLAWGPHVERELMQRARDVGANDVYTRGAFDHGMREILVGLAGKR